MSATYVVGGRVSVRPECFDKNITISDVDTNGKTEPMLLRYPSGKLLTLLALQLAGPSTLFKVDIYDNVACTEEYRIFSVEMIDTASARLHADCANAPFNNIVDTNLYIKVTPATGSGHSFFVRVQADVSKMIV